MNDEVSNKDNKQCYINAAQVTEFETEIFGYHSKGIVSWALYF